MAPDKNWMYIRNRARADYKRGLNNFLDYAFQHSSEPNKILCPCEVCKNTSYLDRETVTFHLLQHRMQEDYTIWFHHGEQVEVTHEEENHSTVNACEEDDMVGLVNDVWAAVNRIESPQIQDNNDGNPQGVGDDDTPFSKLLRDAQQKLYIGCEVSKLAAIVKLLHLKSMYHLTNTAFNALLELLMELIPGGKETLPSSFHNAQKYVSDLGLTYEKYDVCKNNCVIYWESLKDCVSCPVCRFPRWKTTKRKDGVGKIPHKVLRYFPIKPRLQRLYMSPQVAEYMRWHGEKLVDDGVMRHPGDTKAWKHFDSIHTDFALDVRNVRLGLATDGFQPFGLMSSQHSIWPVVLIPYNLPPWLCMKQPYLMLSLIIPGPHSPGMGIDVFLKPLIKDLKDLWEFGVETYDAYSKTNFNLRAAVIWTINDFPAYGDLSGWSTKGYMACPQCHKDTSSRRLAGARKICYMGHRRFLPKNHKWRKATRFFDGTMETRDRPVPLSSAEILQQLENLNQRPFGRAVKTKYNLTNTIYNWRKKSILFQLPYWSTLLIRHNLDVMHIEKNVCDNIIGTIMNINGKTKDTLGCRYDLMDMGIRSELHPVDEGDKICMPAARYTLSVEERISVCKMLADLKTPDGYVSKLSRCVNEKERKIFAMKSHDCHVFMQRLLPLTVRSFLPDDVAEPLIELSGFFRDLCLKSLKLDELDCLQTQAVLTLCKLEMIFPPSFFDIMVHLIVHLAEEAKIAGPVQYRWMYPMERYLRSLKSFVRNKARPEGSIAEAYIADECLTFCSRYLEDIMTKFNRPSRFGDSCKDVARDGSIIFPQCGNPVGAYKSWNLSHDMWRVAQLYVLNNFEGINPFIEKFKSTLPLMSHSTFVRKYNLEFPKWLYNHVLELHRNGKVSDELLYLATGPASYYSTYGGYDVNGFRFHTLSRDESMKTQSSGVMCRGDDRSIEKEYYGAIEEIWELTYPGSNLVYLFKCHWFDVDRRDVGYKVDKYGITSVNAARRLRTDAPFILAYQAEQVFYIHDPKDSNWLVVMKTTPRDVYNVPSTSNANILDDDAYQEEDREDFRHAQQLLNEDEIIRPLNRDDIDANELPASVARPIADRISQRDWVDNENTDDEEVVMENINEIDASEADIDMDMTDD